MSLLPKSTRVDPLPEDPLGYHHNIEDVATTALDIANRLRDTPAQELSDEVCALLWARPGLGAQLILTLAAWLPIETMSRADLDRQAEQVAAPHILDVA